MASCYFYMVFVPKYILILFLIIGIDYISAITIERVQGKLKLFYLVASLTANIGLLAFFKYFNFINENLASVFSLFGKDFQAYNLDIILPIGLSFHTFQSMSYTIEVYRGRQKAEKHLGYFANYVLFFPQMVAGPIERYETLGNRLKQNHEASYSNFSNGFRMVLFGLFVKMTVADNIAPYVNLIYEQPMQYHSLEVLGAVLLFSFQIYADFYGYSTIAKGSARLLGVEIMDNFNTPYLSKSITEFWSRWHISLSTWFRDYLYIPLGGNRVTIPRWCFNIMVVFMVSGLWHGASWTFVVWGALHGLMLLVERIFTNWTKFSMKTDWNVLNVFLAIKTFFIASFIWVFFRAESFEKAQLIFKALISNIMKEFHELPSMVAFIAAIGLVVTDVLLYSSRVDKKLESFPVYIRWLAYAIILFCVMAFSGVQKFTFIYFQF